jgi:hypothetical protein
MSIDRQNEGTALAIEHGTTLYTTDRDFAGFPGLSWVNPLAPASLAQDGFQRPISSFHSAG